MSENDPWKKVGTYVADICLDDGDLIDVDVCLRTQVDAARAAEATQHQQEIAAKDETIDGLRLVALGWEKQRDEARARLAAVEAERDMLNGALEAAPDAGILSRTIDKLAAERDRLKAALEQITALDFEKFNGRHNFYSGAAMFVKAWLLAYAALSGEGTAKP